MGTAIRRWGLLALGVAALHGPVAANSLQCQARAELPYGVDVPTEVHFVALFAGGSAPFSFEWDFGDGESSVEAAPVHTFTSEGLYDVVLEVHAGPVTCADTVQVTAGVYIDPVCGATASPTWAVDSSPITFSSYPAFVFAPPPYTWHWSFGDGSVAHVFDPLGFGTIIDHAYVVPGTYWAAVTLESSAGMPMCFPVQRVTALVPQVAGVPPTDAAQLRIEPPRPNPFALATTIAYVLPRPGRVRLRVVDAQGRTVATLVDGERPAGPHAAVWQGRGAVGARVAPGVYHVVLEQAGEARSARVVRLR